MKSHHEEIAFHLQPEEFAQLGAAWGVHLEHVLEGVAVPQPLLQHCLKQMVNAMQSGEEQTARHAGEQFAVVTNRHPLALAESEFWIAQAFLQKMRAWGREEACRPKMMWMLGQFSAGFEKIGQVALSTETMWLMFEASPVAVLVANEQGQIIFANPQTSELFGYTLPELVGQSVELLVPHQYRTAHQQYRQEYMVNPHTRIMGPDSELYGVRKDGQSFPINVGLNAIETVNGPCAMAVIVDLTITHQLAQTERVLQTALSTIPVGIIVANAQREVVLANLAAIGAELDPTISPTQWFQSWEFYYPDGRPYTDINQLPLDKAILTGQTIEQVELLVRREKETEVSYLLVTAAPILNEAGEIEGGVAIFQDITARKKRETSYRHTQKLESIGILAGGIAHDFNNLLTAIMAENSLALLKLSPEHPAYRPVSNALRGIDRASALTRQLLAYAGKEKLEIKPVNVRQLLEDNSRLLEAMIPSGIEISYAYAPHLPFVLGEVSQLQQVVMNLILNAAEAYDGLGGQVAVALHAQQFTAANMPSELIPPLAPGTYLCLEVADQGKGMDEATRLKLFEPFFTTKLAGRGLGLSAVQGIIEDHHGSLAVQTSLGQGTTFAVYLPAPASAPPSPPQLNLLPQTGQGYALLVDDELAIGRTLAEILQMAGYSPLIATRGTEALDLFAAHQADIRVAVLDVNMPGMSGHELAQKILAQTPHLPIILMTGYGLGQVQEMMTSPNVTLLKKPFGLDQLMEALGRVTAVHP